MNKKILVIIVLVILVAGGGWYFKDSLLSLYHSTANNLQSFQKGDLGNVLNEVKREILTSKPLNVGGKENDVVLTKVKVIAETNFQRYDNGQLPPLIENAKLDAAALAKAKDLFAKQYFEHVSPSGVDPGTLVKKYGYEYIVSGENLILGNFTDEKEVVQDWMNSPGHRANILNTRFADIGVAMVKGTYEGRTVWIGVQEFGLPLSACPAPSSTLKNEIDAGKAQLDQMAAQLDAKKQQIENTDRSSPEYNQLVGEYNAMADQYNTRAQEIKNLITEYNKQINTFNACVAGK